MKEEIMPSQALVDFEVKKPNGSEALAVVGPNPFALFQQALAQGMTLEQMQVFQAMCERWEANEARKAFIQAMNDFKKEPPQIVKSKPGPKLGGSTNPPAYFYAPLDQVCKEVINGLSKRGIAHRWECEQPEGGAVMVTCILTHEMGHSERTTLKAPPDSGPGRNSIQAVASTVTYLQRYTLLAATGLAAGADTDGAAPVDHTNPGAGVVTLPEERYVLLRDGIENAGNPAELERLYKSALAEAGSDQESKRDFQKAKNKAYTRLHNAGR